MVWLIRDCRSLLPGRREDGILGDGCYRLMCFNLAKLSMCMGTALESPTSSRPRKGRGTYEQPSRHSG